MFLPHGKNNKKIFLIHKCKNKKATINKIFNKNLKRKLNLPARETKTTMIKDQKLQSKTKIKQNNIITSLQLKMRIKNQTSSKKSGKDKKR